MGINKDSQKAPNLRFKGFTDDWEQRKFKDFISKSGKKNINNDDFLAYSVSNKLGLVRQSEQFDGSRLDNLDKKDYKLVNPGEFVYNPARINVGSIAYNNLSEVVIVSSLYVVLKMDESLNSDYTLQYINSKSFIKEVRKNTEGSVREYLFFDSFKNIKFPLVKSIEEQQKIGQFFKTLDNTITLHQRKLNQLNQLKEALLQQMFPGKGETVPKLRFAGFEGEWEERKLGEISISFSGGTPSALNKSYYGGNIPFIRSGEINKANTELFITSLGLSNSSAKMVNKGDILYALYGATSGEVGISKINGAINQAILAIKPHEKFDSYFVSQWLKKEKTSIVGTYLQGGQGNLSGNIIKSLNVSLPMNVTEQRNIGKLFSKLDNTITLQQRKLDQLKNMKQVLLENMFI